jgi:hypothetical protein
LLQFIYHFDIQYNIRVYSRFFKKASHMNPSSNPSAFLDITPNLRYEMEDLIRARLRDSLARLHDTKMEIRAGDRVALKINLAVPAPPEAAVGTHPLLLRAVILELQALGAVITVVEDCEPEAVTISGTAAVLAEVGVPFVNPRDRSFQPVLSHLSRYSYATDILKRSSSGIHPQAQNPFIYLLHRGHQEYVRLHPEK